ncbi:MAG TPA: Ig-like domain-containing protein [Thermoanaerobaculia bacterium]|nr:Ig-like domain-containing protein [Thermoanaerobaculia bacterium]
MKWIALLIINVLAAVAAHAADIAFVTPQNGAQAIGPMLIEITTSAANVDRVEFSVDGALAGVARKPPYRIAHDFGTSLAAHAITAKVWSNGFRNSDDVTIRTAALSAGETMNVDVVEVPMRVHSEQPLQASDLRVTENGIPQTIRELRADRGAARFIFIVDRSLSMGDGKLDAALRAIANESPLLRNDDRIDLVLFNHNVTKARVIRRGEQLPAVPTSGGTSLRDALASIVTRERTYAIVITDGGDRNSAISESDALHAISNTKMIVDAIVLGDTSNFLRDAARNTGGTLVTADASTLQRALHALLVDINSRYTLDYQSHGNGPGWRSIAITPQRRGIEIVNARKGYYAR